ncbi:hypothetical protein RhiirA4_424362 [Rhizophagus irregularis]|uniref:Uncharacterized protein n=1 Tax=Rhizophagus irregularis TaxID=588596 RepID=A0A2I1GX64_9GLOM|nr:hypothetical protein RhiirA4_424362 [Rhizophagus irregularis]
MDFNSNNEKKNKRNRYFNIIFLGIFLTEIITYIIGIVILPIRSDWLIMPVSVIFISGIYTIRKELKFGTFLIYGSVIVQGICFYFWPKYKRILGLILLGLTFINTILCHINFGKHHIFLLKFNPNLDKEYEYLNDLDDDDDDDEEEEEEKDEKISEKLNRYWKFIKKLSRIGQEH